MSTLDSNWRHGCIASLWPSLNRPLVTLITKLSGEPQGSSTIDIFTTSLISSWKDSQADSSGPLDFLGNFMKVQKVNPEKMTNKDIRLLISGNMAAGSGVRWFTRNPNFRAVRS